MSNKIINPLLANQNNKNNNNLNNKAYRDGKIEKLFNPDEDVNIFKVLTDSLIQENKAISKKELSHKNKIMIDIVENEEDFENTFKEVNSIFEFAKTEKRFSLIPCFKEATIITKEKQCNTHYYYQLIDKEESKDGIILAYNIQISDTKGFLLKQTYTLLQTYKILIDIDKIEEEIKIYILEEADFKTLYLNADPTKSTLAIAEQVNNKLKNAPIKKKKEYFNLIYQENFGEDFKDDYFISNFLHLNFYINETLRSEKLHTKKKTTKNSVTYIHSGKEQPEERVRIANKVKFTSKEIPRYPTEERIRHYTCLSWQQRGHTRKLQDGREIWVKPCVKHRSEDALSGKSNPPNVKLII